MKRIYRKKPVEVEAIVWTGENYQEVVDFVGNKLICFIDDHGTRLTLDCLKSILDFGYTVDLTRVQIDTLEGLITASRYDFIIKGVNGEFYPCKPDIFAKTYEEVNVNE